jgi:ABC-type uncharacterized transport system permease subunit
MDAATLILKQTGSSVPPLLIAGFGELLAQRAGIINVSIEGTMLMGAVAAFAAANLAGAAAPAFPAAIAVGILMGALFALVTVWCRADQIVAGTALNILAAGASITLNKILPRQSVQLYDRLDPAFLQSIPAIGPALREIFAQYLLFYLALALALLLILLMTRTRAGLVIRALGDSPDACAAAGISVRWTRTTLLLLAGACSGIAGAYLSTMRNHDFVNNMTSGQGFLVLALVIFGRWNVLGFAAGILAFSLLDGIQSWLTLTPAGQNIPRQLFDILPYAATLLALAVLTKSKSAPLHLGRPWPE